MFGPGFRESGDAARPQDTCEFPEHLIKIRSVMESVEAENAIDAGIRQINFLTVVTEEPWRGVMAEHRVPPIQLSRNCQCSLRNVEKHRLAAELCEVTGRPSRSGAEIQHS